MARKAMRGSLLTSADAKWVEDQLLPYLGVESLQIEQDAEYDKAYPDIWIQGSVITVTKEWARQGLHERRKRLLHEGLHYAKGFGHGAKERAMGYFSQPDKDVYTRDLYKKVFR
jgi:hypothetical protein